MHKFAKFVKNRGNSEDLPSKTPKKRGQSRPFWTIFRRGRTPLRKGDFGARPPRSRGCAHFSQKLFFSDFQKRQKMRFLPFLGPDFWSLPKNPDFSKKSEFFILDYFFYPSPTVVKK